MIIFGFFFHDEALNDVNASQNTRRKVFIGTARCPRSNFSATQRPSFYLTYPAAVYKLLSTWTPLAKYTSDIWIVITVFYGNSVEWNTDLFNNCDLSKFKLPKDWMIISHSTTGQGRETQAASTWLCRILLQIVMMRNDQKGQCYCWPSFPQQAKKTFQSQNLHSKFTKPQSY